MISVDKARELILDSISKLPAMNMYLNDAYSCVLAKDILAPIDLPSFNQSAMDGYAIRYKDWEEGRVIKIVGEVAAGGVYDRKLLPGEAVRIFTGACVPDGMDAVIMQEKARVNKKNDLEIDEMILRKWVNIRVKGAQIKKGSIALPQGHILNSASIGFLATMGIASVKVIASPKVSIIVTGSELVKPGIKLTEGKIYESNSIALSSALKSIGISVNKIFTVIDHEKKVLDTIEKALSGSDIVLITGGISVGDYDFVGPALKKLKVKNIFYKIRQKPGKPLFYGKSAKKVIFGIPGNPAAVLSCFYEYVFPAIRLMQGRRDVFMKKVFLPITDDYPKKKGLSFYLKSLICDNKVKVLDGQESFILSSFANADSLVYLSENIEDVKKGDMVEVHIMPSV